MTLRNPERIKTLKDLNVDWLYTWGGKKPTNLLPSVDFVPMIWGYWGKPQSIQKTADAAKESGIKTLLGFNEPDGKKQANMKIEKALKAWPHMMETGLRLGSPACVHPDREWMKGFMTAAKRKDLQVHKLYGKPIWITEFAVGDWNAKSPEANRYRPDKVLKFMEEVLPALEKRDYIEKYAWFPSGQKNNALGTSALFNFEGHLTKLGKFYRDFKA